jgi:hypothetical protein
MNQLPFQWSFEADREVGPTAERLVLLPTVTDTASSGQLSRYEIFVVTAVDLHHADFGRPRAILRQRGGRGAVTSTDLSTYPKQVYFAGPVVSG